MSAVPSDSQFDVADDAGNLNLLGGVILLAGLVLIIFSCFSWLNISGEESDATSAVAMEMTVSGLGSETVAIGEETIDLDAFYEEVGVAEGQDSDTGMPGAWTIAFGVVLVIAGLIMAAGMYGTIATGVALLASLAALIATIVFVSVPAWSLNVDVDGASAAGLDVSTGWSLWLTFVGAIVAFLAALAAAPALKGLRQA